MLLLSKSLAIATIIKCLVVAQSSKSTTGFLQASESYSAGHDAICVTGLVPITISTNNSRLALSNPPNQTVVTEIIQELVQAGSTIAARSTVGSVVLTATYNIEATLCLPKNAALASNVQTAQVLTYGIGLDKSYWDIAEGYSYVDAAANAGYATLAYNRLGVGHSDHPDPIQVVQGAADVEVLHGLVQLLRAGKIGSKSFKYIIGVGQSYGSIVQLGQASKYPQDIEAMVLTSFTSHVENLPYTVLTNNPSIASINDPSRFGHLPSGYLVHDTAISVQLAFFRHPYFDPNIFDLVYKAKQTYALGQQFTPPNIFAPAFKGPVDVVVGQHDMPFCFGDCFLPTDQAAATAPAFVPAAGAGSQSYIVPNVGHFINAHYGAPQAFAQITKFLQTHSF